MMEHPYDKLWLEDAVESQGVLFAYVTRTNPQCDFERFIREWMKSELREQIDFGTPRYACASGQDLFRAFKKDGYTLHDGPNHMDWDMALWVGQFYSYSQWYWNISSAELVDLIPPDLLGVCYPGLHDQALSTAVRKWNPRNYDAEKGIRL